MKLATQTFGLAREFTADLPGTLRALNEAGFEAVEPFLLFSEKQGRRPKNLWTFETLAAAWEIMRPLGMSIPSAHIGVGFGWVNLPVGTIAANILMLHERYAIRDFVVSGPFSSPAQAAHWGRLCRRISEAVTAGGCRILYHNHDGEFRTVEHQGRSVPLMDLFLANTAPEVLLQLDIGWAGMAGDELRLVRRYADRIASIHLKDFYPAYRNGSYSRKNMPAAAFAPIGAGAIRTGEILSFAGRLPYFAGTVIIDQDRYDGDMLSSLKAGSANVRAMIAAAEAAPAPDRSRFSLMTLNLAKELRSGRLSLAEGLRLAAEAGIPAVDPIRVSKKEIPGWQAAMAETGVRVHCLIAYVSLFAGDRAIRRAVKAELETARTLGAELLMLVPYLPVLDQRRAQKLGREKTLEQLVRGFRLAVELGEGCGVKVCFEMTPQEEIRLSGTEDCLAVLRQVPGLGLVFDTANMLPHGDEPLAALEALRPYIVHVHLKDVALVQAPPLPFLEERSADGRRMQLVPAGDGEIPVAELYHRLLKDGYTGSFAIEYARPESGACSFDRHAAWLEKQLLALE